MGSIKITGFITSIITFFTIKFFLAIFRSFFLFPKFPFFIYIGNNKKRLNSFQKKYFFLIVTKKFAKIRFLRVPSLNDFFFFLQIYKFFNFGESTVQIFKFL